MKRFRDELWRLAEDGDAPALRHAAGLLDEYDTHRALAFALAVEGDEAGALEELERWQGEWPFAKARADDVARVRRLARRRR